MLIKISKTSPGVQIDSLVMNKSENLESPCGEYAWEYRLPCDEYTGELTSWCIWNKHQNRFTEKHFLVTTDQGLKTPQFIYHKGVSTP
jgi:hypothetical protein